jgi:hypothetical protein
MKKFFLGLLVFLVNLVSLSAQEVKLNSDGRDAQYVQTILGRSQKIVDGLKLTDESKKQNVLNIIANRYFKLNDIYDKYKAGTDSCNAELYKHHFEFAADLGNYLDESQIEAVKDGLTYGVVPKTYQAHLDMIPSLTDEEKTQVMIWLREAREFAMDCGDSKQKHFWFDKYRGRTNNWLSSRGYDLKKEREQWQQRIEEAKKKQ